MTSSALRKLLGSNASGPITWIKVRSFVPLSKLPIPPCEMCGDTGAPARWLNVETGATRCFRCFNMGEELAGCADG
jgi:hypothetical protein